jgi:hypothetical protein
MGQSRRGISLGDALVGSPAMDIIDHCLGRALVLEFSILSYTMPSTWRIQMTIKDPNRWALDWST